MNERISNPDEEESGARVYIMIGADEPPYRRLQVPPASPSTLVVSYSNQTEKTYEFNGIFDRSHHKDGTLFNQVLLPLLEDGLLRGQDSCFIAYGQCNSGKTSAMGTGSSSAPNSSLLHRFVFALFTLMEERNDFAR